MSLTKFTEDTNVISALDDTPSLTSAQLKAKFDEVGTKIKGYINNTLTGEVDQLVATEKSSLQTSISNLNTTLTGTINDLNTTENAMISDNYSTTLTYKIGDLCIYNNILYKCIAEITEGEAFNSSHWEQTTLGDKIQELETYSTEEKVVGKWIDGTPIYRKVVVFGTLPNNSTKEVSHNIDNLGAVTDIRGVVYSANSSRPIPLIYTGGNIQYSTEISVTATAVKIQTSDNRSSLSANFIIEYTKTTD